MELVEKTLKLLEENRSEWEENWKRYADGTLGNLKMLKKVRSAFNEWDPLKVYTSINEAYRWKDNTDYSFSLRFKGREIGLIKVAPPNKNQVTLSLHKGADGAAERLRNKLGVPMEMNDYPWDSNEAALFRKYFKDSSDCLTINVDDNSEKAIESSIIDEMQSSQESKFNGTLRNIQPARLANKCRFQMVVPLSANEGLPVYKNSKSSSGKIDILARIVAEGAPFNEARLSVLELKKNSTASYKHALAQSSVYSLCIHALLRNPEMGEKWWEIFGYQGTLPRKLTLYSIAMVPEDLKSQYEKEAKTLGISQSRDHIILGDDTIKFGYAFFNQKNGGISITDYSWKGGDWQALPC